MNDPLSPAIELTSRLVAISSVTGDHAGQAAVQDACVDYLSRHDLEVSGSRDARPWTLVRTRKNPAVLFVCHTDTVPVGDVNDWGRDPHSGVVRGDTIHGRGSVDMKGGLAAAVTTLADAAARGLGVGLLMTADEEIGGVGAAEIAESTILGFTPELVIVPEATDNIYSRGHRGAAWFDVVAHGRSAHGSTPEAGINAITLLSDRVISRLDQAPLSRDEYLGSDTINLGMISGGQAPNIVPDRAELTLDCRTVNGGAALKAWLDSLGPQFRVNQRFDLPSLNTRTVPEVMEQFPASGPATYFTDAAVIQVLVSGAPTIIWGPGHPDQMHTVDELMHIDSLEQALRNYRTVVAALG